jgi:hypothetical protein
MGMAALVTPCGLGVREGVLAVGLKAVMNVSMASLCAILLRLWMTSAEILSVVLFNGLEWFRRHRDGVKK